jgi:hypothetical protein
MVCCPYAGTAMPWDGQHGKGISMVAGIEYCGKRERRPERGRREGGGSKGGANATRLEKVSSLGMDVNHTDFLTCTARAKLRRVASD